MGFKKGKTPHQTTLQRLLRRLDPQQVEEAFRQIFLQLSEEPREERGATALAIDGKAQRGRLKFEEEDAYKIHVVSVCDHETGIVVFQGHVAASPKTEEEEEPREGDKQSTGKKKTRKTAKQGEAEKAVSELAIAPFLLNPQKGALDNRESLTLCQRCDHGRR